MKLIYLLSAILLLTGCNTTKIPEAAVIPYPGELTPKEARTVLVVAYTGDKSPNNMTVGEQIADRAFDAALFRYSSLQDSRSPWKVHYFDENSIVFGLNVRAHHLEVTMDFEPQQARLYVSGSRNLKQNGDRIHDKVPVWLQRLEGQVREVLSAAAAANTGGNDE